MARESRMRGLDAALGLFDRLPTEAHGELLVELGMLGRELLEAQQAASPIGEARSDRTPGFLRGSLSLALDGKRLAVKVGLIAGRSRKAIDAYYGRFVEFGRHAQTVVVTRRIKKRRISGNGRTSARTVEYRGARPRKRPSSSPNAGTLVGTPYKLRVRARSPHPFVAQPLLQETAELALADFWAKVLTRTGA